jgi:MoaA/NifB/PqqE/SkfB family radical SAM enzyme
VSIISGLKTISADITDAVAREVNFHRVRPTIATLFLTYRCNSRCMTCTMWKRPPDEEVKKEICLQEWTVVIDRLAEAGIKFVEVFGGNVLLRKELLAGVLEYMHKKGIIIHLPTNQIGLDEETARTIAEYTDYVYISTDGVGEYQDRIRGQSGASSRVESAISMLRRMKKNGRPRLVCNTTVSKFNIDMIERIAEHAEKMSFDELHLEYVGEITDEHIEHSAIDGLKPTPYYLRQGESVLLDREKARLFKEKIAEIKRRFRGSGLCVFSLNVDVLSERDLYEGTIPNKKCYVLRNEVTVDPYGNAVACLFINNYIIGNLVEEPFDSVWNNSRHRRFRAVQEHGELEICKHCIIGAQRNSTFLTALKRIYLSRK